MHLQDLRHDIPELVMLILQQHHQSRTLRVEARRHILDRTPGNLLNLLVIDGSLLVDAVDRAALLSRSREGSLVERHVVGACCKRRWR